MSGVNKVILVGRLGDDPDIKDLDNGAKIAKFSLATSETFVKNNEKVEQTEWHRIIAWNKLSELAGKYLRKGDQVYIEGKLSTRVLDNEDGTKRYFTDVIAIKMTFLENKRQDS